jgi:hypothetical protein
MEGGSLGKFNLTYLQVVENIELYSSNLLPLEHWSPGLESELLLNLKDEETHLWEIYKFGVLSGISTLNQTLLNNTPPSSPLASTSLAKHSRWRYPKKRRSQSGSASEHIPLHCIKIRLELIFARYFKTDNPAGPPMVRIYVGSQRRLWVLPEEPLCDRVQFFKSTFQGGFREGDEKVLELPEDDPIAFGYILDYILQGWARAEAINMLGDPETVNMAWCRTWVLADKLGCPKLSRYINPKYFGYLSNLSLDEKMIPPAAAQYLYENTSETCELRETLVGVAVDTYQAFDCCCEDRMRRWSESAASHPKYLSDIMALLKSRLLKNPPTKVACEKHRK